MRVSQAEGQDTTAVDSSLPVTAAAAAQVTKVTSKEVVGEHQVEADDEMHTAAEQEQQLQQQQHEHDQKPQEQQRQSLPAAAASAAQVTNVEAREVVGEHEVEAEDEMAAAELGQQLLHTSQHEHDQKPQEQQRQSLTVATAAAAAQVKWWASTRWRQRMKCTQQQLVTVMRKKLAQHPASFWIYSLSSSRPW